MKKLSLTLFAALFSTFFLFAQTAADIKFSTVKHVFGKIEQNKPQSFEFKFKNASSAKPLIIETATAECGCTTPEYPKQPIARGKEGKIKVTYNAASPGTFSKKVTVKFAKVAEPIILLIEGEVVAKEAGKSKK